MVSSTQDSVRKRDEDLASCLRKLKARTGRSYDSFARRIGVSSSALHRYCSGDGVPSQFAVLELFAKECKATPDELTELRRLWLIAVTAREADADGAPASSEPIAVSQSAGAGNRQVPAQGQAAGHEPVDRPPSVAPVQATAPASSPAVGSRRMLLTGLVVTASVAVALLILQFVPGIGFDRIARDDKSAAPVVASGPCQIRRGVDHRDKEPGRVWTVDFLCPNIEGAALYLSENSATKVAVMDTTESWFVCWSKGREQSDSNLLWYYTRGDRIEPGAPATFGWGYMAATDVHATSHPWPGMPQCPPAGS